MFFWFLPQSGCHLHRVKLLDHVLGQNDFFLTLWYLCLQMVGSIYCQELPYCFCLDLLWCSRKPWDPLWWRLSMLSILFLTLGLCLLLVLWWADCVKHCVNFALGRLQMCEKGVKIVRCTLHRVGHWSHASCKSGVWALDRSGFPNSLLKKSVLLAGSDLDLGPSFSLNAMYSEACLYYRPPCNSNKQRLKYVYHRCLWWL